MATYLISYDLTQPETSDDYRKLTEYIKNAYDGWAKPLKSVWFIKSTKSATDIRIDLKNYIDSNDKLLIIKTNNDFWVTYNISTKVTEWMQKNV